MFLSIGGNGAGSYGGGGGGGRIAIWIDRAKSWNGYMYTQGGVGTTYTLGGAAGTIYIEESNRGPQYADIKYVDGVEVRTAAHKRWGARHVDMYMYFDLL